MRKLMIIICIIGGLISCNDSTTDSNPPFKHPKEMTWTADTLSPAPEAIQLMPVDLIAFDHDDIWIACWSDVARRVMWHFNGSSWIDSDIQGQSGPIGLSAIAGFSSRDLWAGGFYGYNSSYYAALSHFNGLRWSKTDLNIEGEILDMTTDEEGNIWACGRNGVVLKYSQSSDQWFLDTVIVGYLDYYPKAQFVINSICSYKNKIFLLAAVIDYSHSNEIYYFFSGDINNWNLIDSMVINSPEDKIRWGYYGLHSGNNKSFYSFGLLGVWKYVNNDWVNIFDLDYQIFDMYALADNYIFAVGPFGHAYFYNGAYWVNINEKLGAADPEFVFNNVWTNGYQTVIAGYGNVDGITKTIVWRGR